MKDFRYARPATLKEALALKARFPAESRFICGGTDLLVQIRAGRISPGLVIDLKGIPSLGKITRTRDGSISIGATVTLDEIVHDPRMIQETPLLCEAASRVGSQQIRNRASMAGNICNCSPCADTAPALAVLEASIEIASSRKTRIVPFGEFEKGPGRTTLAPGEMVTRIIIPKQPRYKKHAYLKLTRNRSVDLALASVMVYMCGDTTRMEDNEVKIALGAVSPTVVRAVEAEQMLRGRAIDEALAREATRKLPIKPITDVRSSDEYRMHMSRVYAMRGILDVFSERRLKA